MVHSSAPYHLLEMFREGQGLGHGPCSEFFIPQEECMRMYNKPMPISLWPLVILEC